MRLAILLALSAPLFAGPVTCQGEGVYCDSMYPQYEGRLLQNSNGAIGLISWLWSGAGTDYIIYDGPVTVVDQTDFIAPGIYGMFSLWVDPPTGGGSDQHATVPEPATWVVCLMGAGVMLFVGLRRRSNGL